MKEVRLDLFMLHDENDKGLGRIRIEKNQKLLETFRQLIIEIEFGILISNRKSTSPNKVYKVWSINPNLK